MINKKKLRRVKTKIVNMYGVKTLFNHTNQSCFPPAGQGQVPAINTGKVWLSLNNIIENSTVDCL